MKTHYTSEVLIQNGKVRRSQVIGYENASEQQRETIDSMKPLLYGWLRSRIAEGSLLDNVTVLVRCKHTATTKSLTVEFKVQAVGQPS
jgi:hypothetical protein